MNNVWLYSLLSVIIISLISFIGVVTLAIKAKFLQKILLLLVSFSAGALFGGAFLHLIPEALENISSTRIVSLLILSGILFFLILEKFIHWRHCHIPTSKRHPHPFAIMNLIGDGLHNFIDGLIIGASYLISIPLGFTTTIAVILHEIPQEIGDFGVLLHGGFKKSKALLLNFLSALTSVFGVIVSLIIGYKAIEFSVILLPIAAGGFIYIAGSDLIPEMHKECSGSKSFAQLLSLVFGILLMLVLLWF
ncbi:ZIP family metal transporter [Candidatus Woesearchaeota archaeon B3_Woes]|nr:MAG: ZIP family metal transporter [Candidatus Woesearchaeota archaeon B3_Woes]